jgi:hypothetical protein
VEEWRSEGVEEWGSGGVGESGSYFAIFATLREAGFSGGRSSGSGWGK